MSSYSSSSGVPSGALITRKVDNFAGVDFSNSDTNLARSPDSLNMWKNYKNNSAGIETRPDMELVEEYNNTILGLFFYDVDNTTHKIVHSGTKLYDNGTEIVQRINEMGRRSYTSIPGNFIPFGKNREAKELDEIISVKVKITKPLGGVYNTQNCTIYIIVLTMIAGMIIFIKKRSKK